MVKYQPPPGYKLTYPCAVYEQGNGKTTFANNRPYTFTSKYTVKIIDPNPDTPYVEIMAMRFPMCVMDRTFIVDNLNHYVFTIYW